MENYYLLFIAYLLGSIPSAVWIGKLFYQTDVREYGSGNAGATNTFRVLGKRAGIPVLLIDAAKGSLAVLLGVWFTELPAHSVQLLNLQLALGIAALVGHIFPVFAGFRGGKGIATLLGFMIGVEPQASLLAVGVFILVFITSRIVSLSSMLASIAFPLIVNFIFEPNSISLRIFSVFIALLVLVTHKNNVLRLLKGEESKISFKKSHD